MWKIRELKRIKKEREERNKREKEVAEIARRRNLTDEERKAEDLKLGIAYFLIFTKYI
jgi:microfibrillar-associated protein 1